MENQKGSWEVVQRKLTTGKGYWNAEDVGDYENVMIQYFVIKTRK